MTCEHDSFTIGRVGKRYYLGITYIDDVGFYPPKAPRIFYKVPNDGDCVFGVVVDFSLDK